MRQIGEINDKEQARLFVAYLLTKGINTQVEPEGDAWEIWVKDEDQLEVAASELESFKQTPTSEKYEGALQRAGELQRERERKRREAQQNIVKVSGGPVIRRRGPLTALLIIISGIVCLMTNLGHEDSRLESPFRNLTFVGVEPPATTEVLNKMSGDADSIDLRLASIYRMELWRLITPIFIHFGVFHIVFNMVWLFQLGRLIETRYGTFWFGLLVLITAACSNFAQGVVPANIGGSAPYYDANYIVADFGGMSGVVYGLFGFVWMKSTYDRSSGFRLPQSTVLILLGWLFFCMTPLCESLLGFSAANWGHAIGLVVGMIGGILPTLTGNKR